jgi:hypothetical protein
MKNLLSFSLLVITCLVLFSCSTKDREGEWDDNIKLSGKTFEFGAGADSVTVTTGGNWWWVSSVSVDGNSYYGFADVKAEADSYSIKQDYFIVERRNKNTLFIKVAANSQSVTRKIVVCLEAGDYFDAVTITQKPN